MERGKRISIIAAIVMIAIGTASISYAYWTEEMKIIGECTFEHRITVTDDIKKQKKEDIVNEEKGEAMLPQSVETDLTLDVDDVDHKESIEDENPEL